MRTLALCLLAVAALGGPPRKMTLAFSDEFDGPAIDTAKWVEVSNSPAGTISLKDGKLVLGIAQCPDGAWRGGEINTRGLFEQRQGYFEARIRAGEHPGHHLGFFLFPRDKRELYAEIYVVEAFGDDGIVTWARHNDGASLKDERPATPITPFKGGASHRDFHVYGALWREREITWYIDGREVFATRRIATKEALSVSLVHAVSEPELPRLDPSKLPDDVQFDWVRVWK